MATLRVCGRQNFIITSSRAGAYDVNLNMFGKQGASYGVMLVCVGAIAGAPEEEYHILYECNNILFVKTTVSGRQ
jgi:hypothetical protein